MTGREEQTRILHGQRDHLFELMLTIRSPNVSEEELLIAQFSLVVLANCAGEELLVGLEPEFQQGVRDAHQQAARSVKEHEGRIRKLLCAEEPREMVYEY
jgi:hypothetical protein